MQPKRGEHLNNVGCQLLELDRAGEALDYLIAATEAPTDNPQRTRVIAFANIAEAFFQLGQIADARDAFQEAINSADPHNPFHQFMLATQAVTIGARSAALEFAARFAAIAAGTAIGNRSALDVLRDAPAHVLDALHENVQLSRVLDLYLDPPVTPEAAEEHADTSDASDVFEATRPWRERANSEVMGST